MPGATLDLRDLAGEKTVPGPLGTTGALSTASYVFVWHAVGRLLGQLSSCLRRQSPDCFSSEWEVFSSSVSRKWHQRGALSEDFRASRFFSFLGVCGFSGSSAPGIPPFSVEPLDVLQWSASQWCEHGAITPVRPGLPVSAGGLWEFLSSLRIQNFLCAVAQLPVSLGVLSRAGCSFQSEAPGLS